ncbi:hypothetical protein KGF38_20090, partial [Clostridioides sp. ZZV14-6387]|nr:hypothetical protein [Clostridioides sp. ZZV14-6387]
LETFIFLTIVERGPNYPEVGGSFPQQADSHAGRLWGVSWNQYLKKGRKRTGRDGIRPGRGRI